MASGGSGSDPPRRPTGGKGKEIAIGPPRRRRPNIIRIADAGYATLSSTQRPCTSTPSAQAPARPVPTTQPPVPSASVPVPDWPPIFMVPTPGFQQTHAGPSSSHLSDHDYSTGHRPDQDEDEEQEVEQQEVDQDVVDDIQMLHDGRVAIIPADKG